MPIGGLTYGVRFFLTITVHGIFKHAMVAKIEIGYQVLLNVIKIPDV